MRLNIYYSNKLQNLNSFKNFFMENYFFKDSNILSGRLLDVYFFDIKDYKENNEEAMDIVLIDEYLIDEIYDDEAIQEKIFQKWSSTNKVIFIALSQNFHALKRWSDGVNFIRAFDKKNIFEFLYTEITHDILRLMLDKERLSIFISHAKKDGRDVAKLIKEFIDSDVKLDNFFDETDIQSSESWQNSLEKNLKNSLFLFVFSDYYAHTVWTQKELIWAKEKRVPIVGLDVVTKENKRVFPYIGNTKLVKLLHNVSKIEHLCDNSFSFQTDYNMRQIINALLKESLEHYLFLEENKREESNFLLLTKPPELFDLCVEKKYVLYPDPPLIHTEKEILEKCRKETKISTPLMLKESSIESKNVAISISESNDLEERGYTIEHLNMLMVELARYLFIQNNTLLYGGDLGYKKEFNFTQLLVELQESFNYSGGNKKRIVNYAVLPFSKFINLELKNRYKEEIEFEEVGSKCELEDVDIVAQNLSKMRKKITDKMDVKISVGGKITGFSGFYPGIFEEVYLAVKSEKPTYLIGAFGGMTEKVIKLIKGDKVEELTFEYQKRHTQKLKGFVLENKEHEKEIEAKYTEMYNFLKSNKSENIFISDSNSIDAIISFVMDVMQ